MAVDESLSENLVASTPDEEGEESSLSSGSASLSLTTSSRLSKSSQGDKNPGNYRLVYICVLCTNLQMIYHLDSPI